MSEFFGFVDLHTDYQSLSSETKQQIEREIRRILEEGRQRATKVLTERRHDLDLLAKALVEYEVLNADEMRRILKGEKLQKLTTLPNVPIKIPELKAASPPPLGGASPDGGVLGGNGGLGGSGGLAAPGEPSRPDETGGAKL